VLSNPQTGWWPLARSLNEQASAESDWPLDLVQLANADSGEKRARSGLSQSDAERCEGCACARIAALDSASIIENAPVTYKAGPYSVSGGKS
jgi:hypothetical protein